MFFFFDICFASRAEQILVQIRAILVLSGSILSMGLNLSDNFLENRSIHTQLKVEKWRADKVKKGRCVS